MIEEVSVPRCGGSIDQCLPRDDTPSRKNAGAIEIRKFRVEAIYQRRVQLSQQV